MKDKTQQKVQDFLYGNYPVDKLIADEDLPAIINQLRDNQLALEHQNKKAEDAYQTKSSFLANMSHELRTPLISILGYAQILQMDQNLSETHLKRIATIYHSGEHLLALINNILDISKIEAGRMEMSSSEFNLAEFLENMFEMFRLNTTQKGIRFDYEQPTPLPTCVVTDETHLRQILINLLGNAVKFTEQGKVRFEARQIEAKQLMEDGSLLYTIRFLVEDTGMGIDPDDLTLIFDPFHQAKNHTGSEGTGLGLTISQSLAQLMQSRIRVKSKVGHGSCFWFDVKMSSPNSELFGGISQPEQEYEIMIQEATELSIPQTVEISKLHDLALDGDIEAILELLTELEQTDEQLRLFTNKLRELAEEYQTDKICQLLERYQ
jgi:signal transduction histidine kinase